MTDRMKNFVFTMLVILGLSLIIGATAGLPASAQGIVTGRNAMLVEQLADQVGERQLVQAVLGIDLPTRTERVERRPPRNNRNDRGPRDGGRRGNRGRNREQVDDELIDQLELMPVEIVYQRTVDAGLISQAVAARMLQR